MSTASERLQWAAEQLKRAKSDAALDARKTWKQKAREIALEMREARDQFLKAKAAYATLQGEQRRIRLEAGKLKGDLREIERQLLDPLKTDAEIAWLEAEKRRFASELEKLRVPGCVADSEAARALRDELKWAGRYQELEFSFNNATALAQGKKLAQIEGGVFGI